MERRAAVLLADGFEEGESLFVVDIIRRGGIVCDSVSIEGEYVRGAHDIIVKADKLIKDVDMMSYDMVILPGGQPGATNLHDCDLVIDWVRKFENDPEKYIAAICAAPMVLAKAGTAKGHRLTSYPADKYRVMFPDAEYVDDNAKMEELVVVDGHLITSRGPASTLPFVYKIVEILGGPAEKLKEMMQYNALKEAIRNA